MRINFLSEPNLNKPIMIAAWPGIGNIGLIAIDSFRELVGAEPFAEIEPWDFFYPRGISIQGGVLTEMDFPESRFYFKHFERQDVIFFTGQEQPSGNRRAYSMSSLVLDIAERYDVQRIYTAAAAVSPIHHTSKPRIWGVPNFGHLVDEISKYPNTILMSDITDRGGEGNITGLNGLLLGLARERKIKGACLLGEVPVYISQFPTIYPKSSKAILELIEYMLNVEVDLTKMDSMILEVEENIERLYQMIPDEMRERIDQLKHPEYVKSDEPDQITEEDKQQIMREIDQFFDKGSKED